MSSENSDNSAAHPPARWSLCVRSAYRVHPVFFPVLGVRFRVENKIKYMGRLPQQTTPLYHFIMYIKYIKNLTARNALKL